MQTLRWQRNATEYSGDSVPESTVQACVLQAEKLLKHVTAWPAAARPNLS